MYLQTTAESKAKNIIEIFVSMFEFRRYGVSSFLFYFFVSFFYISNHKHPPAQCSEKIYDILQFSINACRVCYTGNVTRQKWKTQWKKKKQFNYLKVTLSQGLNDQSTYCTSQEHGDAKLFHYCYYYRSKRSSFLFFSFVCFTFHIEQQWRAFLLLFFFFSFFQFIFRCIVTHCKFWSC